jgi:hypothetical protein
MSLFLETLVIAFAVPPRLYKVMRAAKKPCFAFQDHGCRARYQCEQAFRLAYESIKPSDGYS